MRSIFEKAFRRQWLPYAGFLDPGCGSLSVCSFRYLYLQNKNIICLSGYLYTCQYESSLRKCEKIAKHTLENV